MELLNVNIPSWADLGHFMPELILCLTFLVAILADLLVRGRHVSVPFLISLMGTLLALAFAVVDMPMAPHTILGDLVVVDGMAGFFRILFIFIAAITILFSWSSEEIMGKTRENKGEYYALIVLMTAGMCVMAEARDIIMLFLSVEMVGLVSYVLAGYMRTSLRSTEASVKYVLYGAVSSGVMLYGLTFLYGMTGETTFSGIRQALMVGNESTLALLVVSTLVLVGLGYKVAMVPFHFWCPDVYEGSPTPVTAIFSVGPKAAGFALLIRFFYTTLMVGPDAAASESLLHKVDWPLMIAFLSVITMTYGNLVALRQTNVKRLLAYSSIAHVGYLLMGLLVLTPAGMQAILFYLLVYALMNLGAFIFVVAINNQLRSEELSDYAGLGFRAPWAAALMVVFLFSLTGLPPTAGFIGKFYLFAEAIHQDYLWLVLVALLNSVVSLFYYMKITKAMYFTPAPEGAEGQLKLAPVHLVVMWTLVLPTIYLGLKWGAVKAIADEAVMRFTSM